MALIQVSEGDIDLDLDGICDHETSMSFPRVFSSQTLYTIIQR